MTTINKKHVSDLILIEAYADLHKVKDKISLFEKKYCGILNLKEDSVMLQKKWRDEWE